MKTTDTPVRIGIFGHYGNQNLGDESIIEAVIHNLKTKVPNCEIVCLSIDPFDSQRRHRTDAFPIRNREEFFERVADPAPVEVSSTIPAMSYSGIRQKHPFKQRLKSTPLLGTAIRKAITVRNGLITFGQEIVFLKRAHACVKSLDLVLVTGSNQFLDNFGGPFGFPYTLLKWTALAKSNGVKVAFISVGAGPLDHPLSFRLLKWTLNRADYVSVRDEGSRTLLKSRTGIEPAVFPDLAHSLTGSTGDTRTAEPGKRRTVAVNPMPVYDSRYWYTADHDKYSAYIDKLCDLCVAVLEDGHQLELFSTQRKDEDVIDDILARLRNHDQFNQWVQQIQTTRNSEVSGLMETLRMADIVVATRFHGALLPLQLGVPVLGICYYRKTAELLQDVGLGDYHLDLDNFSSTALIEKYRLLLKNSDALSKALESPLKRYRHLLDDQYGAIANLLNPTVPSRSTRQ